MFEDLTVGDVFPAAIRTLDLEADVAGAFNARLPTLEGRIVFDDVRQQARVMMPPVHEFTAYIGNKHADAALWRGTVKVDA
ncbi:MAG: hypothetical protein FJX64_05950 [Alphaproteobacteria bacterium]|nr:hypothetical protein [Alphaproteobacteria bacterium]